MAPLMHARVTVLTIDNRISVLIIRKKTALAGVRRFIFIIHNLLLQGAFWLKAFHIARNQKLPCPYLFYSNASPLLAMK
jgi:hypothetical protein